jgi:hypothetical protein
MNSIYPSVKMLACNTCYIDERIIKRNIWSCIWKTTVYLFKKNKKFILPLFIGCIASLFTYAQVFNVKSAPYNATGNGIADDRIAILAAINDAHTWSLANNNIVTTVYFPVGVYLISSTTVNYPVSGGADSRLRNYVFPVYSNTKFEGVSASGAIIKFANNLFNVTSGGDINAGTGQYFNTNLFYGKKNDNVSNVSFLNFSIDFNGVNNLLPPNQNSSHNNDGILKTIYGIIIDGSASSNGLTISNMQFLNNPGRNDIFILGEGRNLTIQNSVFTNGGRNVGNQNPINHNNNSTDFSFIYTEWDSVLIKNDTIKQIYPSITLQEGSFSGGVEIHGNGNVLMRDNYVYGCKPAIYIASDKSTTYNFSIDNKPMVNVQIRNNNLIDCHNGITIWTKNYMDNIIIDSNTISTMFAQTTNLFPQTFDLDGGVYGIWSAGFGLQCREDFEFASHANYNLNPVNRLIITNNNISFELSNNSLIPSCGTPANRINSAAVNLQSIQNSTIANNVINNMNWAGLAFSGSPWGISNLSVSGNTISNFQYNYTNNLCGYIEIIDYYKPNSDCYTGQKSPTFNGVNITGNTFNSNLVTSNEYAECSANATCYTCFRDFVFDIPQWYGYPTGSLSPAAFVIMPNTINSSTTLALGTSNCSPSSCITSAPPTNIRWFDILSDNVVAIEEEVDHTSTPNCLRSSNNTSKCNIGYRLLAEGGNNHKWTIECTNTITGTPIPNYPTVYKYGNPVIITRGVDFPPDNPPNSQIKVKVESIGIAGVYQETRLVNCIDPGCANCGSNVTISGVYGSPNTESSTWIEASDAANTIIVPTACVRLESVNNSYVQMVPTGSNYFLAAPATQIAAFVAQPLDGCGGKTVARPILKLKNSTLIFPNPVKESFMIVSENILNAEAIKFFDMNGKQQRITIQTIAYNKILIDCRSISKGIYFLKINSKVNPEVKKVIVL